MKSILIISQKNPYQYKWWLEFVVLNIANSLKNKFNITIVCEWDSNELININWVNIYTIRCYNFYWIKDIQFALKIREITKNINPDLVIDNACISFLNQTNKYKTISIVHWTNRWNYNSIKITNINRFFAKIYRLFWLYIQKYYLGKVNTIIAISWKVKKEIEEWYKIHNNIEIINNWTFVNISNEQKQFIINKKRNNKIIFISTDHKWKWIQIVENLAITMKEYKFYICWKEYISKQENIIYLWMLEPKEILKEMISSDIFILPSQYEWQSLAILDAIAIWLPIITTSIADPSISNNIWFIMDDKTEINDIKKFIKEMKEDKIKRNIIKNNNINIMENLTRDNQSVLYINLINKII